MKNIVHLLLVGLLAGSVAVLSSCASAPKSEKKQESPTKKEASQPVVKTEKATPVPAPTTTKAAEAEKAPASSASVLEVLEIAIAKGIQDREAIEVADTFTVDVGKLYCWTKIAGGVDGNSVVHRWKKDGEVIAEITLNVNASPWRTFSSKAIMPEWTGNWVVEVLAGGNVLKTKAFVIQ